MEHNYISIKSLKADYRQNKQSVIALESVDLSLPKGQRGVIIGPSGCGKSTLLNVLAGLNQHYTGQVLVDSKPPICGGKTALILQEYGLLPWKTVWDNVILGMELRKKSSPEIKEATQKVLEKLGLLSMAKRYPVQLSGGQRQRVAIARALILEPQLLLMDEPFSSLDALSREEIQDFLLKIWEETKVTMLLITHNIEEAVFLGQKIFVMSSCPGHIVQEIENRMAGDYNLRGRVQFLEMCNQLRSCLRGGEYYAAGA